MLESEAEVLNFLTWSQSRSPTKIQTFPVLRAEHWAKLIGSRATSTEEVKPS